MQVGKNRTIGVDGEDGSIRITAAGEGRSIKGGKPDATNPAQGNTPSVLIASGYPDWVI